MEKKELKFCGCYEIIPKTFADHRGQLVKPFNVDLFKEVDIMHGFNETYYSISKMGVLRGLHFQVPPMDHAKLVHCIKGRVMDVAVDLRVGSPTFGEYEVFHLDESFPRMIYLPAGFAHGFLVMSMEAVMLYKTSTVHSGEHDGGIHWKSLDIPWQEDNPILSEKDKNLPYLSDYISPFKY